MDNYAWQPAAYWFLTGEEESFKGYKPTRYSRSPTIPGAHGNSSPATMCSTSTMRRSPAARRPSPTRTPSASKASGWTLGVNWYLNQNVKVVLNYEQTSFDGGAAGGTDRVDEKAFLTRMQLGF